jgi:hypothetical protein
MRIFVLLPLLIVLGGCSKPSLEDSIVDKVITFELKGEEGQAQIMFNANGVMLGGPAGNLQDDGLTYKIEGNEVLVFSNGKRDGGMLFFSASPKAGDQVEAGPKDEKRKLTIIKIEAANEIINGREKDNRSNFQRVDFRDFPLKTEEPVAEAKPAEAVSVSPDLKHETEGAAVTITGCDKRASGKLVIPATIEGNPVTSIGDKAFLKCKSLTSITIPDGVTSIGEFAFNNCSSLTSITIPDSVTSIGHATFTGCASLTTITIGNGVTSIVDNAFLGCSSLTSITIPDSVTSIWGSDPFHECTSLTTIEVGAGNVNYTDVNGVLFNEEQTLLIAYPESKTETHYTIPDSVTIIGDGAFSHCLSLTNVTIPESVESIRSTAFSDCPSLTNIMIPASVTNISPYTFSGCLNLTAVTFLGVPPVLGVFAFENTTPTIYRKPEAKGWGETFAGRPVKLISEKP